MIEYISNNLWLFWLIITAVCLILELCSGDFYITCFAVGALLTVCPALAHLPLWIQIIVWAVMSVLSIWLIRPKLVDLIHKGADIRNSNADALIGKIGKVVETIPANGYGYIQVDGDQWKSKSIDDADIALGEKVEIVERESIIMTVRKIKNI